METTELGLMEAIERERTKRQVSDRQFSQKVLGISPSYYCLLKSGKRRITLDVIQILMQKLPELAPEVTIFVMRQGNNGKVPEIVAQTEGERAGLGQLSTPTKGKGSKT